MRSNIIAAGILAGLILNGCSSPAVPWCEKEVSCTSSNVSVTTCETDYDCIRNAFLSAGGNCAKIQNDQDALASCEASLSCSDLSTSGDSSVVAQKCNGQYGQLAADQAAWGAGCSSVGANCQNNNGQ